MTIPLSKPSVTAAEIGAVNDAVASGWISGTGPNIAAFEQRMAAIIQRRHAVAVTNGTVALELALRCLGVGPEDEVIVPALTFAAPAAAVLNVGARLVLVDIDPLSWTLDPEMVKRAITHRTRAIIAVDLLGHAAHFAALHDAMDMRDDIEVIEDAAQAHGALYRSHPCGSQGDISTFSFHANKAISTGEGGLLATNSPLIAEHARLYANHGMAPDRPYYHLIAGSNYRMTNLTAAVGCAQADRWEELVKARIEVMNRYNGGLPEGVLPRREAEWARIACWLYTATIDPQRRDGVVRALRAQGVDARAIWPALVDLPLYRGWGDERKQRGFKVARSVAASAFWLPTWAGMPASTIEEVLSALRWSLEEREIA